MSESSTYCFKRSRIALLASAALIVGYAGQANAADTTTNVNGQSSVIANAAAGDTHTVNVTSLGQGDGPFANFGNLVISGSGGGRVVINDTGRIGGRADFSGLADAGVLEFNVGPGSLWNSHGLSRFGAGDDVLNIAAGGAVIVGQQTGGGVEVASVFDFNEGEDLLVNAGMLLVGPRNIYNADNPQAGRDLLTENEAELRLEGLEAFRNEGVILLGTFGREFIDRGTDRWTDDILSMPGTRYIGEGGEIVFDVNLNVAGGQDSCDASLRNADGDLPASDCVAIVGGSTEGATYVTVNDIFPGDLGAYNPDGIVLVDVSGGESHAGDFVIGPNSDFYSTDAGGVVNKGGFFYALAYDAEAQQHKLVGLPGSAMAQLPLLGQATNGLWRLSTGTWFDRQADLRSQRDNELGGGSWLRVSAESASREVTYTASAYDASFSFDNSFDQRSYAVTGGLDLVSASDGNSAFIAGIMAGYAHSDVTFDASGNEARLDGWTGGVYASLISGGLFVDAAVNANKLVLDHDAPALDLEPATAVLTTDLLSVGAQVEAGWRFSFGNGAFAEPLASLSYVRATIDDIEVPADDADRPRIGGQFDDPASLRAGLGGRVGLEQTYSAFRAQYSVLGRVWNDFEDETAVTISSLGPDVDLVNEFTGQFTEIGFGANLYSGDGRVSGFVNVGGKFGDDYEAQTLALGVRLSW